MEKQAVGVIKSEGICNWTTLVEFSGKAIAEPFDEGDIPLAIKAAYETGTQYRVASGVDETSKLLAARSRRLIINDEGYCPGSYYKYPEELGRGRAEKLLKAGGAAIALVKKDKSGLSDFWEKYRELKEQPNPESSEA